jgi:hypothetical protein
MKKVLLLVAVLAVGFVSCEGMEDIDPVETACAMCDMLDESGICMMVNEIQAQKCAPGETLVFANLKEAFEDGVPLETECRE